MILKGDCISVMKAMKPNSVDAIVCDPPYGLEFMGKEWDRLMRKDRKVAYPSCRSGHGPDAYQAGLDMQLWHTQWLTEAIRVLKPGGSMLVMGGTRTFHRLACAIEDSGFIIKDTLMWIYGSGFPKAQDLGKMIDKRMGNIGIQSHGFNTAGGKENFKPQDKSFRSDYGYQYNPETDLAKHWNGFKVGGIKPAYEPIIWAVKPPEGSYVDNVLKWGVGAVNVDECRVEYQNNNDKELAHKNALGPIERHKTCKQIYDGGRKSAGFKDTHSPKGRFPANVILDEEVGRMLDEQSGVLKSGTLKGVEYLNGKKQQSCYGSHKEHMSLSRQGDSGGASRFFYCAKASRSERNAGLEGMEEKVRAGINKMMGNEKGGESMKTGSGNIRNNRLTNVHPTVKPIKLFEYLIKLVTREGQVILDPFIGSGTTSIAAHNTGRKCVGIEKEDEYLEIAKRRIDYWKNQPKQIEIGI